MPALSTDAQPGFISVADAVKIIEKHTPSDPTVALDRLVKGVRFIEQGKNYTIFLVKKVGNKIVSMGTKPVFLETDYDAITLRATIGEKFREQVGRDLTPAGAVRATSAVIEQGNTAGRPVHGKAITQAGTSIGNAVQQGTTSLGAGSTYLGGFKQ